MTSSVADFVAVVVAAGSSSRFGDPLPKQFHELNGRTVLECSVRAVTDHRSVRGAVVVLPAQETDGAWARCVRGWPGVLAVVAGGATRADSVLAGLAAVGDPPFVLVHDAARPCVSARLVADVVEATRREGAAIPVLAVSDTVKSVEGGRVTGTVPREGLVLVQTPQGSRREWLQDALQEARRQGRSVTDESAALELAGHPVTTVPGDRANDKITTHEDLATARSRLTPEAVSVRVGFGFDVHRIAADRPLVLGGVHFEGEAGLAGHSDADVVLHAAMDAVLGAAGLGDIGVHFPPDDPQWFGADSRDLARRVAALVEEKGFRIVNVDLMLQAEAPRIRPHAERMQATIGECFGLAPSRVGLKATTLEGLGALGRREGIACQAVALVQGGPA